MTTFAASSYTASERKATRAVRFEELRPGQQIMFPGGEVGTIVALDRTRAAITFDDASPIRSFVSSGGSEHFRVVRK